ncbi:MAG: cache domain-containing protein [Acetobacteraceae bacterium]|nr:cache domain-containing protein [Acetobacteraceae bacterium]
MLNRAVREVKADQSKALREFAKGENGFRTMDLYVFCIGPDNKIDAHPNSSLMGQDAHDLRDQNGKPFGAEMLDSAREGSISEIRYLFPKLGSSVPQPKTSFVTRVADQVCGVGYYD